MTYREACIRNVERIRKPYWNEYAYLELPKRIIGGSCDGVRGPWCTLIDPCSGAADPSLGEIKILFLDVDDDDSDWEPFIPPCAGDPETLGL